MPLPAELSGEFVFGAAWSSNVRAFARTSGDFALLASSFNTATAPAESPWCSMSWARTRRAASRSESLPLFSSAESADLVCAASLLRNPSAARDHAAVFAAAESGDSSAAAPLGAGELAFARLASATVGNSSASGFADSEACGADTVVAFFFGIGCAIVLAEGAARVGA